MDIERPQSQAPAAFPKEAMTKMDAIFQKMQHLAALREASAGHLPNAASLERKADSEMCHCDGVSLFYVRTQPGRKQYAVCPACSPRQSCLRCSGTGHKRHFNLETLREDITPFGCECTTLDKRVETLNQSGVPEKYLHSEFGLQDLGHLGADKQDKLNRIQESVYNFCEQAHAIIVQGIDPGAKYFLTLLGPVGTGKTYLATAALKRMILNYGHTGRFVDFQSLLGQLRDTYSKKQSEEDLLRPLREADVLLIDELGKGRTENEWQLEKLDDLVNSRYNGGKVTIMTTNYLPPELSYDTTRHGMRATPVNETFWTQTLPERIGARMYDRILEASLLVDFVGLDSFRKTSAQAFLARYLNSPKEQ